MKYNKLLLSSMVSLALASAASVNAQVAQTPLDLSMLKEASGGAASKKTLASTYIVQLKGASAIEHAEEIGELLPSNQLVALGHNRYDATTQNMQAYVATMKARQQQIAADAGQIDVLYNYLHTFNGFAAKMTPAQADALRARDDIAGVWADTKDKINTANTPSFLGLTGPGGQHSLGIKGEDVIVGILDTGIAPDHPSFAEIDGNDMPYGDVPERWNGACDAGEEAAAATFSCNNKLIGARYFNAGFLSSETLLDGEFDSPRDSDNHGTHVASTAAGNEGVVATVDGLDAGSISGMAPRARIAAYKVCWNSDDGFCASSDRMAAVDQAVVDGVDVINHSIGNSTDFTNPFTTAVLRAERAGVFTAASAGNSGPGPLTVRNNAPWMMSVAASTYDGVVPVLGKELTIDSGDLTGETLFSIPGSITAPIPVEGFTGEVALAEPALACDPVTNPEALAGKIALIARGSCNFSVKILNAQDAGAEAVIVYSSADRNPIAMGGSSDGITIPGVMLNNADGLSLATAVSNSLTNVTMTNNDIVGENIEIGDKMAGFSSRGPNATTTDMISPDITAPGVAILAGGTDTPIFGTASDFIYLQGTSMSSPHIAGLAALLVDQYPDWTPAQIKSALMTTARQTHVDSADPFHKEDGITPADPFDFGAGHVDPVKAMNPGLTYNANYKDYLAFMCGVGYEDYVANNSEETCASLETQGFAMDPSQLNYPSIAIGELLQPETISRTVTDVTGLGGTYVVSVEAPAGVDVELKTFDSTGAETTNNDVVVDANGSASYSLTFTKTEAAVTNEWAFGSITLSNADHVVRSPIAVFVKPDVDIVVPESLSLDLNRGRARFPIQMLYNGTLSWDYDGLVAPFGTTDTVSQDPDREFSFNEAGLSTNFFEVQEGTKLVRFSLRDELVENEGADLDLYVYRCQGWSCSQVETSTNGGSNEDILLLNPEPAGDISVGDVYLVWVHGWDVAADETLPVEEQSTGFTMLSWFANGPDASTSIRGSNRAVSGRFNNFILSTQGLSPDMLYMGAVTFYNEEGEAQGTAVLEVQP